MSFQLLEGGALASLSHLSNLDGALIRYVWGEPATYGSDISGPQGVQFWSALLRVLKPGASIVTQCSHKEIFHLGILQRIAGFTLRDTFFLASDASVGEGGVLYILACRPVEYNFAFNTMQYGVGGLNIEGSRICVGDERKWPANVFHDGSADDVPQNIFNPHTHICSKFFRGLKGDLTHQDTLRYFGALICPPGGSLAVFGSDSMSCGGLLEYGVNILAVSEGGDVVGDAPISVFDVQQPEVQEEDVSILDLWGV